MLWDGQGFLFDPGEGSQRQMLLAGVPASRIQRICVTHFHGDHCLGLPGIIQRINLDQVKHEVKVHYPASQQVYYDRLRRASIFKEQARVVGHSVDTPGHVDTCGELSIETQVLDHTVEAWGWRIQEPDSWSLDPASLAAAGVSGPQVGELLREGRLTTAAGQVRIEDVAERRRGQSMAFIMDTRWCDGAVALARGVDLLVCEATFLSADADLAHEYGHLTADQAGRLAKEAGAGRLVMSHFSQRYRGDEEHLEEAGRHHTDVVAARDLMRIPMPERPARVAAR
jgi:ribonuclease Z